MSKESDWKLFSKKYFEWKNRYLEQFITEYKAILDSDDTPIDKFVELKERINKDSRASVFHLPGRFSRNDMNLNIKALLDTGVITLDDLSEFSDEVKDMAEFVIRNNNF